MNKRQALCSVVVFICTFLILGCAIDTIWFREDDLGTILNGIIYNWDDFIRVFTADCRSFITPVNYQRTAPNVISGFLRPIQNVLFSLVYHFFGVQARAYYLVHVGIHALNAALFYMVCSRAMPHWIALLSGFLFGLYPNVIWLPWIGTVQNSLATFFLLLSVMVWLRFMRLPSLSLGLLAGFLFLLSLLSRETAIFLPLWFAFGGCIMIQSIKFHSMWTASWMFFGANAIYILMRFVAFGVQTLPRTLNNLMLRYPSLATYCGHVPENSSSQLVQATLSSSSIPGPQAAEQVATMYSSCAHIMHLLLDRFISWFQEIFNTRLITFHEIIGGLLVAWALIIFLLCVYRKKLSLLAWLIFGMGCVAWPGVVAYPSPRYINLIYPFVIFIIMYGVSSAIDVRRSLLLRGVASFIVLAAGHAMIKGITSNQAGLQSSAAQRYEYKKRFDDFFAHNSFAPDAQFIIVSSPFVSDIQSIFQAYTGNLKTIVVFDPFATLAEHTVMGCRKPYRVHNVKSSITPILGGFRLQSQDPEHCGWWLRFSDFPIVWVSKTRSYEWSKEPYREGQWYQCSIGSFMINHMIDNDCVADISFVFDAQWVNDKTIFVAWDTEKGKYYVSSSMILSPK